jgi:hypothetical protein
MNNKISNKISLLLLSLLVICCGNSDDAISSRVEEETSVVEEETSVVEEETSVVEEETSVVEEETSVVEEETSVVEEETTTTIPVYQKGGILDVVGAGSEFYKREVTINGVRIMAAGNVGGQAAVPDAFLEKVARMVELFTDPSNESIAPDRQIILIETLSGAPGTYHQGTPTVQRVARGGGDDYSPNFLRTPESYDLDDINDSTFNNDMVWYLNSSGEGFGKGDVDAAEVLEHVFHTIHMSGLDAIRLKQYSYLSGDWASGPLYSAMKEAYDGGVWDSEGYGGDAWMTDPEMFEVAQKEYLYLLNFCMFDYTMLWENGTLSPEWSDSARTPEGILENNPLGLELFNEYIAPAISRPDVPTIRDIFQDGDVGDPTVAGSSGY